jgi:hypothetical protein
MDALLGSVMGAILGVGIGSGFLFCTRTIEHHEVNYQAVSDDLVAGEAADRAMAGTMLKLEMPEEDPGVEMKTLSQATALRNEHKLPAAPVAVHSTALVIAAAAKKAAPPALVSVVGDGSLQSESEFGDPEPPVFSADELRERMRTPTPLPTSPSRNSVRSMSLLPLPPHAPSNNNKTNVSSVVATHFVATGNS